MANPASRAPISVLTDWWGAMGVDVDHAFIDALLRSLPVPEGTTDEVAPVPVRRGPRTLADRVSQAAELAAGASSLEQLAQVISGFDAGPLSAAAVQAVVCDGIPGADLMILGDGPGEEEERLGRPFAGRSGQILDNMLAAIGRSRSEDVLVSNVCYWRVPGGRNPDTEELAVCRPFVDRMVELTRPRLILAVGAVAAGTLLGRQETIMKLRGQVFSLSAARGVQVPLVAMLHPVWLLSRPQDKSRAWRDMMLVETLLAAGS